MYCKMKEWLCSGRVYPDWSLAVGRASSATTAFPAGRVYPPQVEEIRPPKAGRRDTGHFYPRNLVCHSSHLGYARLFLPGTGVCRPLIRLRRTSSLSCSPPEADYGYPVISKGFLGQEEDGWERVFLSCVACLSFLVSVFLHASTAQGLEKGSQETKVKAKKDKRAAKKERSPSAEMKPVPQRGNQPNTPTPSLRAGGASGLDGLRPGDL